MKKKILKQILTVLIGFLIAFIVFPLYSLAATNNTYTLPIETQDKLLAGTGAEVLPGNVTGIYKPAPITGVSSGTAKTAEALGLPSTLTLQTDFGKISREVTWDVNSSSYDAHEIDAQSFIVNGTVTLPSNVINSNNLPLTTSISVTVNKAANTTIYGDYVLIVNKSLTDTQESGTISFDDINALGPSNAIQSLSVNEYPYQQMDASDVFGSSDAMQGLSENEVLYQQPLMDNPIANDLNYTIQGTKTYSIQGTKTYTIGETKELVYPLTTKTFTVRGIGEHCVILDE